MLRSLLVALVCAITAPGFCADPMPQSVIGTKAPSPRLTGLDGKPVAFDSLRGKSATVVVFVSFECPVSNSYPELLNELAKTQAEKGVRVVLVCPTSEPAADVAKAAAGFKLSIPVLIDSRKELAKGLTAAITPEAFVLDGEGVVRYRGRIDDAYSARLKRNPVITSHDLADALTSVLAGKPVAKAVTSPVGCTIDLDDVAAPKSGAVTYHRDVRPILNAHCVVCHRQGEVGPFALTTYNQARRWAADIKEYTGNRQMPPWMPAGGVALRGERKLSAHEIKTLAAWADVEAPEGDPKDAGQTPAPSFGNDGWRHGKPDLILTPQDDFKLGAVGDDLFRVFVIPTGLTENKWVVGYDVKPGNPRVVHHTLHYFDKTGQARTLEKKQPVLDKQAVESGKFLTDRGPGYTAGMGVGFFARGGDKDEPQFGGIGGWAPGQEPQFVPRGMGWLLPAGSDFLIQTHYHRNGQPARDRTQVGLYFAKTPVEQPWQTIVVNGMKPTEKIRAGTSDHLARGAVYLHTDAVLHSVLPHMHLLGKTTRVTMTPPNGKPVVLLDIPAWDYKWQETYWFKEPVHVKAGTKLEIEAVFDNSSSNPNNPSHPPVDVTVGEKTTDEMLFGFFGATSTQVPWQRIRTFALPPAGLMNVPAPMKGEMTPELERFLGNWASETVSKQRGGPENRTKGTETVTKAFDGTYLMIRSDSAGDGGGLYELATYDPASKKYRMWTYTAQGSVFEWDGKWDAAKKAFTWNATLTGNLNGTLRWEFPDADTMKLEFNAKLGPFSALTSTGTMTRKK